jgi:CheY-like chemotaxis protein
MFTQLDRSLERSQGGLGIGLTLVQRLVTLHGGSVHAHSDGPDNGSEFTVRLPALAPVVPLVVGEVKGASDAAVFSHRRILVVDDNHDGADSLAMLLRTMGSEVTTVYDGLHAVQAAGEFRPDVILMDIGLPGLNGYDAARRIRAQGSADVVLIAITGWGQEADRRKAYLSGFDYHLTKPVDATALREILAGTGSRMAMREP